MEIFIEQERVTKRLQQITVLGRNIYIVNNVLTYLFYLLTPSFLKIFTKLYLV